MSTSVFRKLATCVVLAFFLAADLSVTIFGLSETVHAAVEAQEINQASLGNDTEQENEEEYDITPEEAAEDALLEQIAQADSINQVIGNILDKPSIILDPYDKAVYTLYVKPELAINQGASQGSDKAVFEQIIQDQFGLNPSLTSFDTIEGDQKLYNLVLQVLADNAKRNNFIKALKKSVSEENGFVTGSNVAIIDAIIAIAENIKSQAQINAPSETKLKASPEVQAASRGIVNQFTKVFDNIENGTPVLVALFQALEPLPLDIRVVNTLLYLVTPRDQGGAGHERIKVQRIWRDYAEEKNAKDRERKDADNESAHHRGQAIDISEIDNVKCTIYKSGWFRRNASPRPPIPVKVDFQSEDTLSKTAEGQSNLPLGFNSMYDVFKDLTLGNITDGLSDLDLDTLDEGSLRDAGMSDILKAVGEQLVLQAVGMVGGSFKGFNFTDIVTKVGQAYLADKLGLPRYSVKGSSLEEIEGNVGRAELEKRLGLPPESLKGNDLEQILRSVGARKLETSLNLRRGTLTAVGFSLAAVGEGYIEQTLGFKLGVFSSNSLDGVKSALGSYRFNTVIGQNPAFVDDQLKIPPGTTEQLLKNSDAGSYKQKVGKRVLDDAFRIFPTFKENVLSYIDNISQAVGTLAPGARFANPQPDNNSLQGLLAPADDPARENSEVTAITQTIDNLLYQPDLPGTHRPPNLPRPRRNDLNGTLVSQAAQTLKIQFDSLEQKLKPDGAYGSIMQDVEKAKEIRRRLDAVSLNLNRLLNQPIPGDLLRIVSRKDEIFGTPPGSLDRLVGGDSQALVEIGAKELASHLSYGQTEREIIYDSLINNKGAGLGATAGTVSASTGLSADDFRRFFDTGSPEVIQTLGEKRILNAVLNLPESQKFKTDFLADHPDFARVYQDASFRTDRLRDIRGDLNRLDRLVGQVDPDNRLRGQIDEAIRNPSRIDAVARNIGYYWDRLSRNEQVAAKQEAQTLMEDLRRNFRALVDGQYPRSPASVNANQLSVGPSGRFDLTVKPEDVLDLLGKRKGPAEVLQTIGFRAVEGGIGLPSESLYLFSKTSEKSPDNFFASVGQARVNDLYGKGGLASLISRNQTRADRDFVLKRGTTDAYLRGLANVAISNNPQDNAYAKGNIAGQSDLDGDPSLTPAADSQKPARVGDAFDQNQAADPSTGPSYVRGYNDGLRGENQAPSLLTKDGYLRAIGRQTLIFSSVRRLTGGLQIDGLTFGPDDIYQLVTGGAQDVFARVAGYRLDQQLHLYPGTLSRIIGARNGQERDDAIAIAGGAYLGNLLGMGPIDFRGGDPTLATGASLIENKLGLKEGSVRQSDNLSVLEQKNPKLADKLQDGAAIDDILKLDRGTTEKLTAGRINLKDYVQTAGQKNLEYQLIDSPRAVGFIIGVFGIDRNNPRDQHERDTVNLLDQIIPRFSHAILDNSTKSLTDWSSEDRRRLFSSLDGMFGLEFDRRTHLRPGTWSEVVAHPERARQILVGEGISALDQQLNLDGKLRLAYNFYQLRQVKQDSQDEQKTVALSSQRNSFYHDGFEDGQSQIEQTNPAEDDPSVVNDVNLVRNPRFYNPPTNDAALKESYDRGFDDALAGYGERTPPADAADNAAPAGGGDGVFRTVKQKVVQTAENEAATQIQQILLSQFGVNIPFSAIIGVAYGDVRTFQYIGMSEAIKRFNQIGGTNPLPPQFQIGFDDLRGAFEGVAAADSAAIDKIKQTASQKAASDWDNNTDLRGEYTANLPPDPEIGPAIPRDEASVRARYIAEKTGDAQADKQDEIKRQNQSRLQYKMADIAAYRLDGDIPPGFTEAMFNGNADSRNKALLGYVENHVRKGNLLGFDPGQGIITALYDYFNGPRDEQAFQNIIRTGAFNNLEREINKKKLLGFDLPDGSLYAIFHYAQTGNADELNPFANNSAVGATIGGIVGRPIFSWADKTFRLPTGSTFQIAKLSYDLSQTLSAVAQFNKIGDFESSAASTARGKLANLKGQLTSLVVTTFFQKQLLAVDKALGLVPGSMGGLIGYAVSAPYTAFNPVTLGITIGLFLVMNVFGFNKTQLICTADGYYPRVRGPAGQPKPDLYLGLGEFDGINPEAYRQGLMLAARGRVRALVEDLLEMPYHISQDGQIVAETEFNDAAKPIQIITRRPEDFQYFFDLQPILYKTVFNEDEPGPTNRQGILTGSDYLVDDHVHIGF